MKKLKKIIQACRLRRKLKAREGREIEKKVDKKVINIIKQGIKKFEEDGYIKIKWVITFDELTFENKITEGYVYVPHLLSMSNQIQCEFYRLENAKEGQRLWGEFLLRNADKIAENIKKKFIKQMNKLTNQ